MILITTLIAIAIRCRPGPGGRLVLACGAVAYLPGEERLDSFGDVSADHIRRSWKQVLRW